MSSNKGENDSIQELHDEELSNVAGGTGPVNVTVGNGEVLNIDGTEGLEIKKLDVGPGGVVNFGG